MRHLWEFIRTVVSVSLLVALTGTPALALVGAGDAPGLARAGDAPGVARAMEVQESHTPSLLNVQGVVGTAVGLRVDGAPVIKIYTEDPGVGGLPNHLDGVPVVVEVTGKIFILPKPPGTPGGGGGNGGGGGGGGEEDPPSPECDPTAKCDRPVPIGVSTGHPSITAGTIGARVIDGSGNVYALSNNHVYANENLASIGDAVIQPGTYDGGTSPADDIGTLSAYKYLDFTGGDNTIDAAIAIITKPGDLGNSTPSNGYGTPKSTTVVASFGLKVMKYGRTTGQTKGRVDAINATVNVGYSSGTARFVGQIIIKPGGFSAGGDSGSLIVVEKGADKRKPVGLLFAGSPILTVANPIDAVLEEFGVTIDGE